MISTDWSRYCRFSRDPIRRCSHGQILDNVTISWHIAKSLQRKLINQSTNAVLECISVILFALRFAYGSCKIKNMGYSGPRDLLLACVNAIRPALNADVPESCKHWWERTAGWEHGPGTSEKFFSGSWLVCSDRRVTRASLMASLKAWWTSSNQTSLILDLDWVYNFYTNERLPLRRLRSIYSVLQVV